MLLMGLSHAPSVEAPPLRRYHRVLFRNTGHRTLVAIFASVWLLVFQNTPSMSSPFRGLTAVGSVIAEVTVRLAILAVRLGHIPRLFGHR